MSSPDGTKVQVNFRAGDDLINVYAQDETELLAGLVIIQQQAGTIHETGALLRGVGAAAPLLAGAQQIAAPAQSVAPTTAPAEPSWGTPTPTQPAPVAQAAPAAGNPAHACLHGARVFKSGNNAKGPWAAWFCPTAKDAADKCEPEWVRV